MESGIRGKAQRRLETFPHCGSLFKNKLKLKKDNTKIHIYNSRQRYLLEFRVGLFNSINN